MVATNRGYQTIIRMERRVENLMAGIGGGEALSVTTESFTADDEWIAPAGLVWVEVTAVAGGGSGAGAAATQVDGEVSVGSGGGSGEVAQQRIVAAELSGLVPLTIGIGGTAAVGSAGGNGSPTSFGTFVSAAGGRAGIFTGPATGAEVVPGGTGGRTNPLSAATQYLLGADGAYALALPGSVLIAGSGGYCPYGKGGVGPLADTGDPSAVSTPGVTGIGHGAGGSGAITRGAGAAAVAGGDGAPGVLFIHSYTLA